MSDVDAAASVPEPKKAPRIPVWATFIMVALIAMLIAAPVSVGVYIAHQHQQQQAQIQLGAWWGPVSLQLEGCSQAINSIKQSVAQGTGTQVTQAGRDLQTCLSKVDTAKAPDDVVQLAFSSAMYSLNAIAEQTIRLGALMHDKTLDQSQPDQLAAYVALTKQFAAAQVTLLSLQAVVRQAGGTNVSSSPTPSN